MKQYYIYITTNLINGKKYIGQHHGELDDSYLGSGNTFKEALEKYGKENFKKEILEICDGYDSVNIAERKWIDYYNAVQDNNFYNIASGGFNSNPVAGMSEEADKARRKKLSEACKGEKNYFYGKHISGKDHPWYGRHHTEESKKKMSLAKQGGKAPTAKGVAIYTPDGKLIKIFDTQRDLKIFLGLSPNGSTDTLHKYIASGKIYHGYIVKFIEQEPVSTIS